MTPRWSPPAPRGATCWTGFGRVAARDMAATTMTFPVLRTRRRAGSSVSRPPSAFRLPGAQPGVFGLQIAVVGFQFGVAVCQMQDLGDPGDVDALRDKVADPRQAIQILVAVAAGAAVGARRGEQAAPLVQAQRRRIDPAEL